MIRPFGMEDMTFIYDARCLKCGAEYELHPRCVIVGPLDEQVVAGQEEVHGIASLRTTPLYSGAVLRVCCPACLLEVRIAFDLAPHSLRRYVHYQRDSFSGLQMDHVLYCTSAVCRIREFPLDCPRCEATIAEPGLHKTCKECGSNQLQVLRSRNDQAEQSSAPYRSWPRDARLQSDGERRRSGARVSVEQ